MKWILKTYFLHITEISSQLQGSFMILKKCKWKKTKNELMVPELHLSNHSLGTIMALDVSTHCVSLANHIILWKCGLCLGTKPHCMRTMKICIRRPIMVFIWAGKFILQQLQPIATLAFSVKKNVDLEQYGDFQLFMSRLSQKTVWWQNNLLEDLEDVSPLIQKAKRTRTLFWGQWCPHPGQRTPVVWQTTKWGHLHNTGSTTESVVRLQCSPGIPSQAV